MRTIQETMMKRLSQLLIPSVSLASKCRLWQRQTARLSMDTRAGKPLKKLKLKTVPVIIADDLTEEQVRAFRLADNKVAEIAQWDIELLLSEIESVDNLDMTLFGFADSDYTLDDFEDEEADTDISEDEIESEGDSVSLVEYGDIYQLGRHRLMCGDSTSAGDMKELVNGEKIDLYVTDPPYNVAYEGKTEEAMTIQNDSGVPL